MDSNLKTMLAAYTACALWSSNDESDDRGGEPLDRHYFTSDIHPATLAAMERDCTSFLEDNAADIGDDYSRAGYDFWLTRNGHGAGFWDGDWPKDAGDRLTAAAKVFGDVDLYVGDDGKVYQSGDEPTRDEAPADGAPAVAHLDEAGIRALCTGDNGLNPDGMDVADLRELRAKLDPKGPFPELHAYITLTIRARELRETGDIRQAANEEKMAGFEYHRMLEWMRW